MARQKEINHFVETLLKVNDQSVSSHQKFKQMIGYKEKKLERFSKSTLKMNLPNRLEPVLKSAKEESSINMATVAL